MKKVLALSVLFAMPLWARPKPVTDHIWMTYVPVQCFGNPWEQEWIKKTKKPEIQFPRAHESKLFREYYSAQGLTLQQIRRKTGRQTCNTCDCPRGDSFFIRIPFVEVDLAQPMGFHRSTQAEIEGSAPLSSFAQSNETKD